MNPLTPEQLRYLSRFGFDPQAFAALQARVQRGELTHEHNRLRARVTAPPPEVVQDLLEPGSTGYAQAEAAGVAAIRRGELGIVILNGGMATRFGGVVKGVVEVLPGHSFLRLKVADALDQARRCQGRIPVYVLDSFATDDATRQHFAQHQDFGIQKGDLRFFLQFIAPRLNRDGSVFLDEKGQPSFYAPGHGDFVPALRASGVLREFLARGGKHLLLSNVDNLGARVAPALLGQHILSGRQITVEVAPKRPGDQGGAPALVDGVLQIVEGFRFPADFAQDSIPVFNCNTFTFAAAALDRDYDLAWYYVEKKAGTSTVVQLERLVGELTRFCDCLYLRVPRTGPRSRFHPIKTPEDLTTGRAEIAAMFSGVVR